MRHVDEDALVVARLDEQPPERTRRRTPAARLKVAHRRADVVHQLQVTQAAVVCGLQVAETALEKIGAFAGEHDAGLAIGGDAGIDIGCGEHGLEPVLCDVGLYAIEARMKVRGQLARRRLALLHDARRRAADPAPIGHQLPCHQRDALVAQLVGQPGGRQRARDQAVVAVHVGDRHARLLCACDASAESKKRGGRLQQPSALDHPLRWLHSALIPARYRPL
jgi:hypothetical protein